MPNLCRTVAAVTLHQAPVGASVRVTDLSGHPRARRLAELGLRPGAMVEVLRRTSGGGRLLGLGTARLAVDRATADAVVVEQR
jgi:ferrous iron transport protein A